MQLYMYIHILSMCVFFYAISGTGRVLPNPKAAFKFKTGVVLLIGVFFIFVTLLSGLVGAGRLTTAFLWLTFSLVLAYGLSLECGRCLYVKEMYPKQYRFLHATSSVGHNSQIIKVNQIPETKIVRLLKKATSTSIFLWVGSLLIDVFGPLVQ